jgi:N-methylhydantoinase B/oxoprolinase/acetone carboxylase alpha subunit
MYLYVQKRGVEPEFSGTVQPLIIICNEIIMPNHPVQAEGDERAQVAIYVASMSADLANMARRAGLDALGYLLEMVRLEAENAARHMPGSNGD